MRPSESRFLLARRFSYFDSLEKFNSSHRAAFLYQKSQLHFTIRNRKLSSQLQRFHYTPGSARANIEQKPYGASLKLVIFLQTLAMWKISCLIQNFIKTLFDRIPVVLNKS